MISEYFKGSCSTSPPGGNQVDGLPPAPSNIGASVVWQQKGAEQIWVRRQKIVKIGDVPPSRFHSY